MGDKLLLSFGAKLQRLFDFKCEITKLPSATFCTSQRQDGVKF